MCPNVAKTPSCYATHTHAYHVIVGNVGTVKRTDDITEAWESFASWRAMSMENKGRAAGEEICVMGPDGLVVEYVPAGDPDDEFDDPFWQA